MVIVIYKILNGKVDLQSGLAQIQQLDCYSSSILMKRSKMCESLMNLCGVK